MDEPHSQVEPPLHPAGIGLDRVPGPAGEADLIEDTVNCLVELLARKAVQPAPKAEVLSPGQILVERRLLRDDPEPGLHRDRVERQIHPVEQDAPLVRPEQAGEH